MKIIEMKNEKRMCPNCKSLLLIEPVDIECESSYLGKYTGMAYYICPACKAKNYNVPESFKKGKEQEYERRMSKTY